VPGVTLKGGVMDNDIVSEFCKYVFDEDEKREFATDMARKVAELNKAENDLKAVKSDYKSQIDGLTASVQNAATKLNNGYEMRNMDCEKQPCWESHEWQMVRVDTGEIVKTRKMSSEDLQMKVL
jgi:hypothetical protein